MPFSNPLRPLLRRTPLVLATAGFSCCDYTKTTKPACCEVLKKHSPRPASQSSIIDIAQYFFKRRWADMERFHDIAKTQYRIALRYPCHA